MSDSKVKSKAVMAAVPMATGFMVGAAVLYFMGNQMLSLMGLAPAVANGVALLLGGFAAGAALFVARSNMASYQAAYKGGVVSALKQYAKSLSAADSKKLLKDVDAADTATLDSLMKRAGYKDGYSALLGSTNQMGYPRVPNEMVDIHGNRYNSKTGYGRAASALLMGGAAGAGVAMAGDDDFPSMDHDQYKPSVNIDGSPMMGDVDINGNPFGVTNDF